MKKAVVEVECLFAQILFVELVKVPVLLQFLLLYSIYPSIYTDNNNFKPCRSGASCMVFEKGQPIFSSVRVTSMVLWRCTFKKLRGLPTGIL